MSNKINEDFDINELLFNNKEEIERKYESYQATFGVKSNKLTNEDISEWMGQ